MQRDSETVAVLMRELLGAEAALRRVEHHQRLIDGPPVVGSRAAFHLIHATIARNEADSARERIEAMPGAARLRLLAEAAGARMDAAWLRQAVARVALAEGMEAEDVLALPLHGFAELVEALDAAGTSARRARRRRGRGRVEDRARDLRLLRDWRAARAAGVRTIAEFARARGMELDDVRSALDRARKPPRRGASQRPRRRAGK